MPQRTGMVVQLGQRRAFRAHVSLLDGARREPDPEAESRSYRPFFASLPFPDVGVETTRWAVRRELIQLVANDDLLVNTVRPNLGDINDVTPWRVPELMDVLGSGVVHDASEERAPADAAYPEATPYLDAFDGEIAYREGDLADADRLSDRRARPPAEGRGDAALAHDGVASRHLAPARTHDRRTAALPGGPGNFPSIFRLLDLRVPVRLGGAGERSAMPGQSSRFSSTRARRSAWI